MTAPIIGWARPEYLSVYCWVYHAVLTIDPRSSVITACRGRWPAHEPREYLDGRDVGLEVLSPLCGACERIALEQRDAAAARVRVISWPMTASDFDLGGESG